MPEPTWLRAVRLRARRRMLWCRSLWAEHHYTGEEMLAITHSEVERTLASARSGRLDELGFFSSHTEAREISAELDALEAAPADERWQRLTDTLGLSADESALLACALAAEWEPALRRVFGYLQDEAIPLDASPALAAALWGRESAAWIGAASALVGWRLARPVDGAREPESGLTSWLADPLVLEYLIADGDTSARRTLIGAAVRASREPALFATFEEVNRFVEAVDRSTRGSVEVELTGPPGSGKATLAAQIAEAQARELITVDCRAIAGLADPCTAAIRELRHALLTGSAVLWRNVDALPDDAHAAICARAPLAFRTAAAPSPPPRTSDVLRRTFELEPLDRDGRVRLWTALAGGPPPGPVREWALRASDVAAAAHAAPAGEETIHAVCKRRLLADPSDLVSPLPLPYTWDDFVASEPLLDHLRELEAQCRYRGEVLDGWGLQSLVPLGRGVNALFAGPSGTGKTMAAQVLARELGLELLRVDLAGVVNKYIGETEKHLRAVFDACERAPVLLFFDEADALFGKRTQVSDAHDRFANIEIDYLLQRMEEFDGVAVLATNRKGDIDSAFLRRLRFVVDFAPPTVAERNRLWRTSLERVRADDGQPISEPLDWGSLARDLELTGAGIKASALAAAFLARTDGSRITVRHVVAAARRELEKQGVVVRVGVLDRSQPGGMTDRAAVLPKMPMTAEAEPSMNGALS